MANGIFYVYLITNKVNNKKYVGITSKTIEQRWKQHISSNKKNYLYNSIKKYGIENFTIKQIDKTNTWENACDLEFHYIKAYDTFYKNCNGYNMTYGGEGFLGYKFNEKDIYKRVDTWKKNIKENPEIVKKWGKKVRVFYENNPKVLINRGKKISQTLKENPEISKKVVIKRQKTYANNPEIDIKRIEKRLQTLKENPEISINCGKKISRTLKENPEIVKKRVEKYKQICKKKKEIKLKCLEKIKEYNIEIEIFDERKSIQIWKEFQKKLIFIIFRINRAKRSK